MKRRNKMTIPAKTVKYHYKSARFTGMMSDIGIERIGDYVRSMEAYANVLAEMTKTGIINHRIIAEMADSISQESELTGSNIILINNSLVRFIHADSEKIKGIIQPTTRGGKPCSPENTEVFQNPDYPVPDEAEQAATFMGDARE